MALKSVPLAIVTLLLVMFRLPMQAADAAPAYAGRGAYSVGVMDFSVEQGDYTLNATMWYPALNPDGAEARFTYSLNGLVTEGQAMLEAHPDAANGPYPVIIYSHGLFGARFESIEYVEHLASWGFVVMAADHVGSTFFDTTSAEDVVRSFGYRPQDVTRLIDHAEAINAEGIFAGLVEMDAIGVTGFSFGGYTSLLASGAVMDSAALADACETVTPAENALCDAGNLQLLAETVGLDALPQGLWQPVADERVKAVVAMAPCCVDLLGTAGTAEITVPMLVMAGTADTTAPAERNGELAYENASSTERALVLIEDAGHEVYLDIYSGEIARAHDLIQHFATGFFLTQLKGDAEAAALLTPGSVNFDEITYSAVGMSAE
jgi:predicted dienelactone hydrolase